MIQQMLTIWSLVPLPLWNPACAPGSSWFTNCWSLAWRILSITLPSMWKSESENCSVTSDSSWHNRLYSPWNFPGQNTGIGSCSLLQGILPTQRSNPGLPHCRWILYQLSHQGSPRILEWITYPFSRVSSQPRDRTQVSHIAGRFFTSWATREVQEYWSG